MATKARPRATLVAISRLTAEFEFVLALTSTVRPKRTMLPPIWLATWASQRARKRRFLRTPATVGSTAGPPAPPSAPVRARVRVRRPRGSAAPGRRVRAGYGGGSRRRRGRCPRPGAPPTSGARRRGGVGPARCGPPGGVRAPAAAWPWSCSMLRRPGEREGAQAQCRHDHGPEVSAQEPSLAGYRLHAGERRQVALREAQVPHRPHDPPVLDQKEPVARHAGDDGQLRVHGVRIVEARHQQAPIEAGNEVIARRLAGGPAPLGGTSPPPGRRGRRSRYSRAYRARRPRRTPRARRGNLRAPRPRRRARGAPSGPPRAPARGGGRPVRPARAASRSSGPSSRRLGAAQPTPRPSTKRRLRRR